MAVEQALDAQTAQVQSMQNAVASLQSGAPVGSEVGGFPIERTETPYDFLIGEDEDRTQLIQASQERLKTLTSMRDDIYKTWKTMKDERVNWTPQNQVAPPYPSAPEWMPQYVPGLESEEMITKQGVPPLSGQQTIQLSTSRLRQLGAYKGWVTGQDYLEGTRALVEETALMQPETPFGRTRWSPAGTRV